jgi:hypothetical protein
MFHHRCTREGTKAGARKDSVLVNDLLHKDTDTRELGGPGVPLRGDLHVSAVDTALSELLSAIQIFVWAVPQVTFDPHGRCGGRWGSCGRSLVEWSLGFWDVLHGLDMRAKSSA